MLIILGLPLDAMYAAGFSPHTGACQTDKASRIVAGSKKRQLTMGQ